MSVTFQRLQRIKRIKRIKRLCNNIVPTKRGDSNYDPMYKYDYIFTYLVYNNVSYISEKTELGATNDETTLALEFLREGGAGIIFGLIWNPNVSKDRGR